MFWIVGYNLMYGGTPNFFGAWDFTGYEFTPEDAETGYASYSDWFFQMVFCATTASIVSGTVAERIKFWPFIIFTALLTGIIYPIVGSWEWGGGYLDSKWAFCKYVDGKVNPIPGSNMPLATLGVFILWLGWFGFNGASQLAMGTIADADAIAKIFVNTNMAAVSGVIIAVIYTQIRYGKIDLTMALNGALAGLVAITAEPLEPAVWQALVIGGIGSLLACLVVPIWTALKVTIGLRVSEEVEHDGLDSHEVGIASYPEFVNT